MENNYRKSVANNHRRRKFIIWASNRETKLLFACIIQIWCLARLKKFLLLRFEDKKFSEEEAKKFHSYYSSTKQQGNYHSAWETAAKKIAEIHDKYELRRNFFCHSLCLLLGTVYLLNFVWISMVTHFAFSEK